MADGGGGGGGGGGYNGGAGGPQTSGDNGAFSGSNGADLLPAGFVSVAASNAGGISSGGGSGSVSIIEGKLLSNSTKTITINNTGNGANLAVASVAFDGVSVAGALSANVIGYNFSTFTGNNATFTLTAANLSVGTHRDTMTVTSNAANGTSYIVPLNITVLPPPNGTKVFSSSGQSTFVVPEDVYTMDISLVGGGGGTNTNNGSAGAVVNYTNKPVTPGETMYITVGTGGGSSTSGSIDYEPVFLSWAWSSFMNSFAVWGVGQGDSFTSTRMFSAPSTGNYTFEYQADNYLAIYVDGSLAGTTQNFQSSTYTSVALTQGTRALTFIAQNYGGPRGFAVTIKNSGGTLLWATNTQLQTFTGTPGGVSTISAGFGTLTAEGGAANGNSPRTNGFRLHDGSVTYGTYGDGASDNASSGQPGAVLLTWGGGGGGASQSAYRVFPLTLTTTSPGVTSSASGPSGSPGYQYNTTGGNAARSAYAPVSRYWIADSTSNDNFAWSRGVGFICPNSNITADELRSWGFDPSDVIVTTEASLKKFAAGVDSYFAVGHATLRRGDISIASAKNITTVAALSDRIANRHYRSSDSNPYESGQNAYGLGPWTLPTPGINEFIYLWVYDDIGTESRTITITYTS
jgi:hypothetical protein